jgi:DNA-binding MarR family transcriptional regulator
MVRGEVGRGARAASRQMRAAMIPEDAADHPSAGSVGESGHAAPLRLEEFLPYRLNVVANLVSQALSRIYAERYDIGVPEWRVLVTLGQYGVMTAKQIGEHTHMHKTKVSRAVAQLEKRKFVARRANRDDLRESFLSLAAPGRTIYEDLAPSALEFAARLVEVLEPHDRIAFDRALTQLIERSAALVAETLRSGQRGTTAEPHVAKKRPVDRPHDEEDA